MIRLDVAMIWPKDDNIHWESSLPTDANCTIIPRIVKDVLEFISIGDEIGAFFFFIALKPIKTQTECLQSSTRRKASQKQKKNAMKKLKEIDAIEAGLRRAMQGLQTSWILQLSTD